MALLRILVITRRETELVAVWPVNALFVITGSEKEIRKD